MALKGTLKDFGIADILQLIGQQQKTGTLTLTQGTKTVVVAFKDGHIVRAGNGARNRKDLIGAMLVRAGLITDQQLEAALEQQRRTLQRLGDVLVSQQAMTAEKFRSMVELQTNETLFQLFSWKSGSYAFEQGAVEESEPSLTPLQAESVLMEGFRRVDEWPAIRKRITSPLMTFERIRELPPPAHAKDAFDAALDDALSEAPAGSRSHAGPDASLGENERRVFALIEKGRTFQELADLSCLGDFEAAKALSTLVSGGLVRPIAPSRRTRGDFERQAAPGLVLGVVRRLLLAVLALVLLVAVAIEVDVAALRLGFSSVGRFSDPAVRRFVGRQQLSRIEAALRLFRLEHGELPRALQELVANGMLFEDDLRHPWKDLYYYRRLDDGSYVLLPPLR